MKFSVKIFLCSVIILALALSVGGYLLIQSTFDASLERERGRALAENLLIEYGYETAAFVTEDGGSPVSDQEAYDIAAQLAGENNYHLLLTDEARNELYRNTEYPLDDELVAACGDSRALRLAGDGDNRYILIAAEVEAGGKRVFLQTERSVGDVFAERTRQFSMYRVYSLVLILAGALASMLVSGVLTRPLIRLTRLLRRFAEGDYSRRVSTRGGDEIRQLAMSFNAMADSVEENVRALTLVARQREDFVANFAHELKTPLTSIIGYADVLRSQNLPPEKAFTAANYIYSEGRRLESLSLKLLEMIVVGRRDFHLVEVQASAFLREIGESEGMTLAQFDMELKVSAEDGVVRLETDLFRTMLINLIDNARKASEPGGGIELAGRRVKDMYVFTIADHGRGIPEEELSRITEAFYMVDKSRARAQNGAGLGLALCDAIAQLHHTRLRFTSAVGAGTSVSLSLPLVTRRRPGRRRA